LVFRDEFDGDQLDTKVWDYRTGVRFWSTQLPANVAVADGLLRLACRKERVGQTEYTAGGVITKARYGHGYYEARLRCPPTKGWHTSFWMMQNGGKPDELCGELDVIENDSSRLDRYGVNCHHHRPAPHVGYGHKVVKTPDLSADFHTFGCLWTAEQVVYSFDGQVVQTVDVRARKLAPMNIWLTTIAAPLGGTDKVDESRLPVYAEYDWVRYWVPVTPPAG